MVEENQVSSRGSKPHYVGIGASAGGLEAIQAFFKNMPGDSGLTFIIIQHLSPDYKSMMDELLAKVTEIPVQVVSDGIEAQPNNIYLIPPRKSMSIFHGKLLLSAQDRSMMTINLPIDVFFHSLAEDQGGNAIGIILSGTGSDGTRGCRAIKEAGGLVMVQSEASAKFGGMPKSVIANGLADFIQPVEDLPKQLLRYVNHPLAVKAEIQEPIATEKSALAKIFSMLRAKSKIDFTFYKPPTITRRIERRMTINQVANLDDYVDFLTSHPQEQTTLYRELLIGVTNFFRDENVFEGLQNTFLKQYIQNLSDSDLRVWVAGCSTGEEAYTYAILLREVCDALDKSIDIKIFATDIDQDALAKASQGGYPESVAVDIPKHLLNKYFMLRDENYQILRQIREMVVFARHDLIKDPPFTNIDIVSCRNLLIYLQPILQRRIFDGFNFSLKPGGLLILGNSESLGEAEPYFDTLDSRHKVYKSRGNRKSLLTSDRFSTPDPLRLTGEGGNNTRREELRGLDESKILDSFIEAVAGSYLPFAMMVNENNELIRVIGDPTHYLHPLSGKVSIDIGKNLVKDLNVPVLTGLSKVFKTRSEVNFTNVRIQRNGKTLKVNLMIKPLSVRRNQPLLAAVFVNEVEHDAEPLIKKDSIKYDVDMEIQQRIGDLEQELQFTRENLQATIEELETSNEELQATNEELLASNEELQSTNEELQSVNEELFTVNSEYQGKISELSELNADLDNFMNSSGMAAVFLDDGMRIRKFTSNAKNVFNIMDHDVGRPFQHISHHFLSIDLLQWSREVSTSGIEWKTELRSDDGNWYHMRILPYMLTEKDSSGIVIVINEINALKKAEAELLTIHKHAQLAQTLSRIASWEWDLATDAVVWFDPPKVLFDQDHHVKHTYRAFIELIHPDDRVRVALQMETALKNDGLYQIEHRIIRGDGSIGWVEQRGTLLRNEQGQATHILGVIYEIDERKAHEAKITQLNRVYRLIFGVISEGIYGMDQEGRVCFANPKACELIGWSEAELIGRYQHEFLQHQLPDGRVCGLDTCPVYSEVSDANCQKYECAIHQALKGGKQRVVQDEVAIHKDGTAMPVRYTATPMYEGNSLEGVVVVLNKIQNE
jgi:two-component system CheB/CheR fusion protein